jgi:hydrogenase maturation factor
MHDPTEGGIAAALWELAEASGRGLLVEIEAIHVLPLAARLCAAFGLDPLATIASGALLLAVPPGEDFCAALELADIPCYEIGRVIEGEMGVWQATADGRRPLARPARDEIARLFDRREPAAMPARSAGTEERMEQ